MQWFGKRGESFFDAWTVVHLAFWLVVGANFEQVGVPHFWRWAIILVGAFVWEAIEVVLDSRTDLEMTHEGKLNRWVSDPIMAVAGGAAGMYLIGG